MKTPSIPANQETFSLFINGIQATRLMTLTQAHMRCRYVRAAAENCGVPVAVMWHDSATGRVVPVRQRR
jgi:hypothetical protein